MLPSYETPYANPGLPVPLKLNRKLTTRANKILVIDDDEVVRLGFDICLKAADYNPCFAHDAKSALSTALTERPDLIILDISLPDYDGYFVMRSFNEFPELANVPIIVLTGLNAFSHQARCADAGAKRFFEKPITNLLLMTAIQQLLG